MNRTLVRRAAIGAAALVALVAVAGAVFTATFDVNRYKPQIVTAVHERTGRTLKFDGDLSLSLFPRLAVKLPATTLSDPGRDTVFARLRSAQASVALLPLLRRQFEVDGVRIDGLQATVVRQKDGTTNIDDLLKPEQGSAPAAGQGEPTGGAAARATIGAVELKDADVTWRDLASGRAVRFSGFDLRAGRYAPGARMPLEGNAAIASNDPALAGKLNVKADVEWAEQGGLHAVRDLVLKGEGSMNRRPVTIDARADQLVASVDTLDVRGLKVGASRTGDGGVPTEVQLLVPRVQASQARATADRIELSLTRRGAEPLDVKVVVDGVQGTSARLEAATVKINGTSRSGPRSTRFDIASSLIGSVSEKTLRIERATGEVMTEDPALGAGPVRLPLTASGTVDARRETVALELETRGEGLNGRGRIRSTGFSAPRIVFDIDADHIDVDRYFPNASSKGGGGAAAASPAGKTVGATAAPALPDSKVDFSALRGLDAAGALRIARLRVRGTDLADVKATVRANAGRLDVAPFSVRLHGGSVNGRLGIDAGSDRVDARGSASGIQLRRLAGTVGGRAAMEGAADGTFDLTTAGTSVNQMKRALGGSVALNVRDGALVGIDLTDLIGTAAGFLQSRGRQTGALDENRRTPFSQLSASIRIKDGVATNDDLKANSPQLDIAGSGRLDVVSTELDYTLRAQVVAGPANERSPMRSFAGLTVPVRITGPVEHPGYAVDWAPIAAEALLKRATGRTGTPSVNRVIEGLGELLRRKK